MIERLQMWRPDSKLAFVLDVRGSVDRAGELSPMLCFSGATSSLMDFRVHPRPKGIDLLDQIVDLSFADGI